MEEREERYLDRERRKALDVDMLPHNIERVVRLVTKYVHGAAEPLSRNDMRKNRLPSKDRAYLDNALAHALKQRWIEQRPDGSYEKARGLAAV